MNKYKIGEKVTYKKFGVIRLGTIYSFQEIITHYPLNRSDTEYEYRIERTIQSIENYTEFDYSVKTEDIITNQVTEEILIKLKKLNTIAKNMRKIAKILDEMANDEIEFNHWSRIKWIDKYLKEYKEFLTEEKL